MIFVVWYYLCEVFLVVCICLRCGVALFSTSRFDFCKRIRGGDSSFFVSKC